MTNTVADDFAHFLSYSGFSKRPADEIERLRMAYEHGAKPAHEPSADPLDAWSDIHSAPKDGNRILALVPERQFYANTDTPNELIPVVVRWVGEFQGWTMPGISGLRPVLWQSIRLTEAGAEHG